MRFTLPLAEIVLDFFCHQKTLHARLSWLVYESSGVPAGQLGGDAARATEGLVKA
ncbi:hypothetical protein PUR25_00405 [Streptomyces sp. JV181]|uniref:hypothetical protein n=1 Tax=Streptomyces sp. JV181 TaxID=858635 RepID=UPI002E7A6C82|nr:hypothetical protein [Streptomyces sp. JV181]MEE1774574.1 hypothetical protein [Streptomyces sp. JV181]